MQRTSDAMVTVHDIDQAVQEKSRGHGQATMKRLFDTEPLLAVYIEGLAAHFSNQQQPNDHDPDAMANALDRLIVIVRAIEIGQYRLWRGSIDPRSPLGRMISPTSHPADDQKE